MPWCKDAPMNAKPTIADAVALAARVHRDQVDKAGEPYILHPLRLLLRQSTEGARMVAVLHDVIEDSPATGAAVTAADLQAMGFTSDVVGAIEALTRREEESYEDFIERVARNPLARQVKIADLEDNMNILRLSDVDESKLQRLAKYHRAWKRLQAEQDRGRV